MLYELKKEVIPKIIEDMFDNLVTASDIDQSKIARDIAKEVTKEHRTSQQLFIKLLSNIINEYENAKSDPRNNASVNWCKKVSKIDNNFPFI